MKPQKITTPFVTPERVAEVLGISKTRVRQLERIAREIEKMSDFAAENKVETSGEIALGKSYKKAS